MRPEQKHWTILLDQEVLAGLLCILFGAATLVLGRTLPLGTALRMGPGYVPMLLSWGFIVLGATNAAFGLMGRPTPLQRWHPGPVLRILLSIAAFSLMIESAGVLAASATAVVIAQLDALRERPGEVALLAIAISLAATAIFVLGLGLPINALPGG